jgi:hypothetical protein
MAKNALSKVIVLDIRANNTKCNKYKYIQNTRLISFKDIRQDVNGVHGNFKQKRF